MWGKNNEGKEKSKDKSRWGFSGQQKREKQYTHNNKKSQSTDGTYDRGANTAGNTSGGGEGTLTSLLGSAAYGAGQSVARRAVAAAFGALGAQEGARAGEFDLYLFAQSWAPRFCCAQAERCAAQGMHGLAALSPHGLWPSYSEPRGSGGHTFPAYCGRGSKKEEASSGSFTREAHEWYKHGTCTTYSREQYAAEEERVHEALPHRAGAGPSVLQENMGQPVAIEEVRGSYHHAIGLQADGKCRLKEITTCFSADKDGKVGEQIDCPAHVMEGSRNQVQHCSNVYLDQPGVCAAISRRLLQSMEAANAASG